MINYHTGRCGIHAFEDEERAKRPCGICAENREFFAQAPTKAKRPPSHHRPATPAQKAWFGSAIKIAGERNKERGGKLP